MNFSLTKEEKFGLSLSAGIHFILLLITLWMVSKPSETERIAFIEITLGEYQAGTEAAFSREEEVSPITQPEPVETISEEPAPEPTEIPTPETIQEEAARDVELPEQEQEIEADVVVTPETEKIDPEKPLTEDDVEEEPESAPTVQMDESEIRGEREAGDIRGIRGRANADQGSASDPIRASPFQLEWEGDIRREPMVQPLPDYVTDTEAVISFRFEVRPDGTVGRLQPIIKANPELEREVMRTLRTWRFSRLPSHLPQESQFGTITFRFVLE